MEQQEKKARTHLSATFSEVTPMGNRQDAAFALVSSCGKHGNKILVFQAFRFKKFISPKNRRHALVIAKL